MSAGEIHVGDTGTVFVITLMDGTTVIDISGATTKEIIFQKPDSTKLTKEAAFATDGTDGVMLYTTTGGDLSIAGAWRLQVNIVNTSGAWKSDIGKFTVYDNL